MTERMEPTMRLRWVIAPGEMAWRDYTWRVTEDASTFSGYLAEEWRDVPAEEG